MDDKAVDRLYLAVLKDVGSGKQVGADRQRWEALLGPVAAFDGALVGMRTVEEGEGITVERFGLETDEVTIPVVIVRREEATRITIALSGAGKAGVIQERAAEVESMLGDGAVCLVDVRGIGELEPEEPQTFRSRCAARAATALMLGESILGMQVRDLRTVIAHLRSIGYEEIVVTGWVEEGRGEVEVAEDGMILRRKRLWDDSMWSRLGGFLRNWQVCSKMWRCVWIETRVGR